MDLDHVRDMKDQHVNEVGNNIMMSLRYPGPIPAMLAHNCAQFLA